MNSATTVAVSPNKVIDATERSPVDDSLNIPTPEKISFEYELAGPVRRLFAWLIDLFLVQIGYWAVVGVIVVIVTFIAGLASMSLGPQVAEIIGGMMTAAIFVGSFVITWFYGAWMEAVYNGQTLGKSWTDLRVLSRDGGAINSGQAIIRNIIRFADLMPFVPLSFFMADPEVKFELFEILPIDQIPVPTLMVGLIVMMVLPGFRRLGDLVAGTIVVSERGGRLPEPIRFEDPRVAQLAELLPTNFVPGRTLGMALATYVDSRQRLGPERCAEIAVNLGPKLIEKLDLMKDTNHDLLLCSLYFRTFVATEEKLPRTKSRGRA